MTNLVLAFDTETTGLPLWHEPSDHKDQPHVVSLAMELCDADGKVLDTYDQIVNIGVPIPPDTIAIHGITDEMAAGGIPPAQMLADFEAWVARASVMTGFNVTFDQRMMRIQAARHLGRKWETPIPYFDTCFAAKDVCKIPAKKAGMLKKPNLTEAMQIIFGKKHEGAHSALPDTIAARRLYFALRDTMAPMLPKSEREPVSGANPVSDNPRVQVGDNMPPPEEAELSPYEQSRIKIEKLYEQAKGLLDGEGIDNELRAMEVGTLRNEIRDAANEAERFRKVEAKVFDDGKAEVQARYNPLIQKDRGKADLAIAACNAALAPYLKAKDDALRAEADKAAAEAVRVAKAAREAAQAAATSGDLSAREQAEALLNDAKGAVSEMKQAERAKSQVKPVGGGRAIGMKTIYEPELIDPAAAIEHYRKVQPAALKAFMLEQAVKDIRAGPKPPAHIPGFKINDRQVPA
jgi:DNA polymerase-3 subunit epsilon